MEQKVKRQTVAIAVFKKDEKCPFDKWSGKVGMANWTLTFTKKNPNDLLLRIEEIPQFENKGYGQEQPKYPPRQAAPPQAPPRQQYNQNDDPDDLGF